MKKRLYSRGYHVEWLTKKKVANQATNGSVVTSTKSLRNERSSRLSEHQSEDIPEFTSSTDEQIGVSQKYGFAEVLDNLKRAYTNAKDSCDKIIDQEGDEILGKVTVIGLDVIKYKRCDHLDGPTYSIPKSAVLMIEYSNGKREIIKSPKPIAKPKSEYANVDEAYYNRQSARPKKRLEGLGLAGFIITLSSIPVWWFVSMIAGLAAGVLGIVFGSIGIHRCRKDPDYKWGKGFAITSLIVGLILLIVSLVFILLLL